MKPRLDCNPAGPGPVAANSARGARKESIFSDGVRSFMRASRIPPLCSASPDHRYSVSSPGSQRLAKEYYDSGSVLFPYREEAVRQDPFTLCRDHHSTRQRTAENQIREDAVRCMLLSNNAAMIRSSEGEYLSTEPRSVSEHDVRLRVCRSSSPSTSLPLDLVGLKGDAGHVASGEGGPRQFVLGRELAGRPLTAAGNGTVAGMPCGVTTAPCSGNLNAQRRRAKCSYRPRRSSTRSDQEERSECSTFAREQPCCRITAQLGSSAQGGSNGTERKRKDPGISEDSGGLLVPYDTALKSAGAARRTTLPSEDCIYGTRSQVTKKRRVGPHSCVSPAASPYAEGQLESVDGSSSMPSVFSTGASGSDSSQVPLLTQPTEPPQEPFRVLPKDDDAGKSGSLNRFNLNDKVTDSPSGPGTTSVGSDGKPQVSATEGPSMQSPLSQSSQVDLHSTVELVLQLWKPLPPSTYFLEARKPVMQELREVLAEREKNGHAPVPAPPSPTDSENRAYLLERLSAPLPAERHWGTPAREHCRDSPEELLYENDSSEPLLCTGPCLTPGSVTFSRETGFVAGDLFAQREDYLCYASTRGLCCGRQQEHPHFFLTGGMTERGSDTAGREASGKHAKLQLECRAMPARFAKAANPPEYQSRRTRKDKDRGLCETVTGSGPYAKKQLSGARSDFSTRRSARRPLDDSNSRKGAAVCQGEHAQDRRNMHAAQTIDASSLRKCCPTPEEQCNSKSVVDTEQLVRSPQHSCRRLETEEAGNQEHDGSRVHSGRQPPETDREQCEEVISCVTAKTTRSGRRVKLNLGRFPGLRSAEEPVPA